jgi:hypothetical protein
MTHPPIEYAAGSEPRRIEIPASVRLAQLEFEERVQAELAKMEARMDGPITPQEAAEAVRRKALGPGPITPAAASRHLERLSRPPQMN